MRGPKRAGAAADAIRSQLARASKDGRGWLQRYLPFALSMAWQAFFAAFYGMQLTPAEQEMLRTICGFSRGVPAGYAEALVVAGRRGGKSAVVACIGLFEAVVRGAEHMRFLAPGQRGYVAIISRTQRQALEVFRYARAIVERNAELAALLECDPLESATGGELRFRNGVVLTVMPASKSSIRGYTVISGILDEFAWVASDEDSADQDEEIASAVRFAMLAPVNAPKRRLLIISSPAAKVGLVYDTFTKYHGRAEVPVLVAHGPTWTWNPTIDRAVLELERGRDPKRYAREVLAEFSDAVSPWCDGSYIDRAADGRTDAPLAAVLGTRYVAGVDMAFRRDSAVLCVGHLDGDRFVVDLLERVSPTPGAPLDAVQVVTRFAVLCKSYGVKWVLGDQFAVVPLTSEFRRAGLELREETATNASKLEHFGKLREHFYAGRVSLPAHEIALRELRQLEERMTGAGNVYIGAPNRASAHDDCAAAIAWCFAAVSGEPAAEAPSFLQGPSRWNDVDAIDDDDGYDSDTHQTTREHRWHPAS